MASNSAGARICRGLGLFAALAFCACSEPGAPAIPGSGREVTLADGHPFTVHSRGLRVFPASASVVDFLIALAPPARVVALPEQALDYASVPAEVAAWKSIPRFSAYVAEAVIARSPDLVIAEPWQDANTSERLRSAGIEVVVLPEVRTWREARATLLGLGQMLALEAGAQRLVRELDLRVEKLTASVGPRRGLRVMSYSNFGSGGSSAGANTTVHEQIVLAGMVNAMGARDGHVPVSFEDLIALDPDLILVSKPLHGGEGTQGDRGGASQRLLENEPSLRGLGAIQRQRIVALPPNLFATGSQSIVAAAEALAAAVDGILARENSTTEVRR